MRHVALAILPLLLACDDKASAPDFDVAMSDLSRERSPDYSAEELDALVAGNTAFALDLYHLLREGDESLFLSPYSVSIALAMTWAGARGETEAGMAEALQFTLSQERLHPTFNGLDLALDGRADEAEDADEAPELHIANSLWGQVDYPFLSDYLDTLALNYGAGVNLLDFISDPEGARETINGWVEEQTQDRIKDLIAKGGVTADTRLVLTNAIYFKAAWDEPFDEDATRDGTWTRLDGSTSTVQMMHQTSTLPAYEGDGFVAVELPYDGGMFSMVALLPDAGTFTDFEAALDGETFSGVLDRLGGRFVDLSLPRFGTESSFSLADPLGALGMAEAFGADADFTGMEEGGELHISNVIHKSFIAVDEAGTEAAAATAVTMETTGDSEEPDELTVRLDRPFVYAIIDRPTGSVLFLGRQMDPN